MYRRFNELNHSYFNEYTYAIESSLHEWLLQSRHRQAMQLTMGSFSEFTYHLTSMLVSPAQGCHCNTLLCRTLDPQEADFFNVPSYASRYMHPVWGEALLSSSLLTCSCHCKALSTYHCAM